MRDESHSTGDSLQPVVESSRRRALLVDLVLVLLASGVAELGHFSWQSGRYIVNADSVQYVDNALALVDPSLSADFGFRKPGYSFVLAGILVLFGQLGWSAILVNHVCLGLVPLAAYGVGRELAGRWGGVVAALFAVARLQTVPWADRLMSEPVYALLITLAVWAVLAAVKRNVSGRWWLAVGGCLAAAWLVRATALTVIVASLIVMVWHHRHAWHRPATAALCLLAPCSAAVLLECGLNLNSGGRFRPCTGSLGTALYLRTRSWQGDPPVDTARTRLLRQLLPERGADEAYRANLADAWVGWYRARTNWGMDEWEVNRLMRRGAIDQIAADPGSYLAMAASVFRQQVLRLRGAPPLGRVPESDRRPAILPPGVSGEAGQNGNWYRYWALPHRSEPVAAGIVADVERRAGERAPWADAGWMRAFRYLTMLPPVRKLVGWIAAAGSLWPGLALLLCWILRLDRRACAVLAVILVIDAALIALTAVSDASLRRFLDAWTGVDAALAAALWVAVAMRLPALAGWAVRPPRAAGTAIQS